MNLSPGEEIVRSLYEGILDQEEWRVGLEKLRCLTNSEQVAVLEWDREIDETLVTDICRPDARLIDDYERNYSRIDPTKKTISTYAVGQWYLDVRDMGIQAMRKSAFYQDFMRNHGLSSILSAAVIEDGPMLVGLSFQAGMGQSSFDGDEIGLLAPITPHIQRAIMLRSRFRKLSRQAELGSFVLDRFHTPVMVVDADGKIVLSNANAESWLAGACLQVVGKAGITLQIKSVANRICDPNNPMPLAAMKSCIGGERNPCYLVGLPLKADHPLASQWSRPVGVIIVHQVAGKKTPWEELFRSLFGLSPAEVRLVQSLADHDSLYDAAMTLGVSKETARSHLKSVFHKTGVNKQATLSRMVAQLSQLL